MAFGFLWKCVSLKVKLMFFEKFKTKLFPQYADMIDRNVNPKYNIIHDETFKN